VNTMKSAIGFGFTALTGALLMSMLGCYSLDNEAISGNLRCSDDPVPQCPDGFACVTNQSGANVCVASGELLSGGRGGSGASGGSGGSGGEGGAGGQCLAPIPGCTPLPDSGDTGVCDPVCQTGCCNERCIVGTNATSCTARADQPVPVGGDCDALQGPLCERGAVCLVNIDAQRCGSSCYRYCRADADCPGNAKCSIELETQTAENEEPIAFAVCDVPPESCDPTFGDGSCAREDRLLPNFGCYVSSFSTDPDSAVCDCAGTLGENETCEFVRSCRPGLACVESRGEDGATRCQRVCAVDAPAAETVRTCGLGRRCVPAGGSSRFGICRP